MGTVCMLNSHEVLSKILATKLMEDRRSWVGQWLESYIINEETVRIWEDEGLIPLEEE